MEKHLTEEVPASVSAGNPLIPCRSRGTRPPWDAEKKPPDLKIQECAERDLDNGTISIARWPNSQFTPPKNRYTTWQLLIQIRSFPPSSSISSSLGPLALALHGKDIFPRPRDAWAASRHLLACDPRLSAAHLICLSISILKPAVARGALSVQ